jgi:hypothetical protein
MEETVWRKTSRMFKNRNPPLFGRVGPDYESWIPLRRRCVGSHSTSHLPH